MKFQDTLDKFPTDENGVWNGYAEVYSMRALLIRGNYKNGFGVGYFEFLASGNGPEINFYIT